MMHHRYRDINRDIKGLGEENELLKQKIEGQGITIQEKTKEYLELKKHSEMEIYKLNAAIDSANTVIADKEEEIETRDDRLKALREAQKVLTNKDDIIENLKTQIFVLDEKFTLARQQLKEKDLIIFALTEKYELERELRFKAEELLDKCAKQIAAQDSLIKNLEKELAHRKVRSLLSQIAWGGVGLLGGILIE